MSYSDDFLPEEKDIFEKVFKVVSAVFLMAKDPNHSLISPIVMKKDQEKYDLNSNTKYVEKAKRRGLVGWDIGKDIEFSPHMRRPHFGLRWTGKGREVPKIVPINGCIVRRNKMTKVPTGYLEPKEIESKV